MKQKQETKLTVEQVLKANGLPQFGSNLKALLFAYGDCNGLGFETRSLDFFSPHAVKATELTQVLKAICPEGYNEFDPRKNGEQLVRVFGEKAEFFLAREGSVCVYVKPSGFNLWIDRGENSLSSLKCDELSFDPSLGMFRVWWD